MKMDILYLTIYVHSECNKVKDMIFLQMGFVKHHNSIIRNGINDSQNVKPTFMEISQVGNIHHTFSRHAFWTTALSWDTNG